MGLTSCAFCVASFFNDLTRISSPTYLPTDQDILRTRVRSTGIVEEFFTVDTAQLLVVDVGGQRSERKKWLNCFEDCHLLIFVAAISEYDQVRLRPFPFCSLVALSPELTFLNVLVFVRGRDTAQDVGNPHAMGEYFDVALAEEGVVRFLVRLFPSTIQSRTYRSDWATEIWILALA